MEPALFVALGGLGANVAVAWAAIGALRSQRQAAGTEQRKAEALEALAKSQKVVVESLERDLKEVRAELASLRALVGARNVIAEVKMAELEERKRQAEWQKQKEIFKGLGWLLQNAD